MEFVKLSQITTINITRPLLQVPSIVEGSDHQQLTHVVFVQTALQLPLAELFQSRQLEALSCPQVLDSIFLGISFLYFLTNKYR